MDELGLTMISIGIIKRLEHLDKAKAMIKCTSVKPFQKKQSRNCVAEYIEDAIYGAVH